MNKKGQIPEQLMFIPYMILLGVIFIGIVIGTTAFFGSGYDSRKADSEILNSNIQSCITSSGIEKIKDSGLFTVCNINQNVVENNKIMIKVCEREGTDDCINEQNPVFSSGSNFQACKLVGAQNNKAYPKCALHQIYVNGELISIITGSNQQGYLVTTK